MHHNSPQSPPPQLLPINPTRPHLTGVGSPGTTDTPGRSQVPKPPPHALGDKEKQTLGSPAP